MARLNTELARRRELQARLEAVLQRKRETEAALVGKLKRFDELKHQLQTLLKVKAYSSRLFHSFRQLNRLLKLLAMSRRNWLLHK